MISGSAGRTCPLSRTAGAPPSRGTERVAEAQRATAAGTRTIRSKGSGVAHVSGCCKAATPPRVGSVTDTVGTKHSRYDVAAVMLPRTKAGLESRFAAHLPFATCVHVESDGAAVTIIDGVDIPPEMNAGTADLCPAKSGCASRPAARPRRALRGRQGMVAAVRCVGDRTGGEGVAGPERARRVDRSRHAVGADGRAQGRSERICVLLVAGGVIRPAAEEWPR
jgi:hypothetical protein